MSAAGVFLRLPCRRQTLRIRQVGKATDFDSVIRRFESFIVSMIDVKTNALNPYYIHTVSKETNDVIRTRLAVEIHCVNFDVCKQAAEVVAFGNTEFFFIEPEMRKIGWYFDPDSGKAICRCCINKYAE